MDSYVVLTTKKSVRSIGRRTSNHNVGIMQLSHSQAAHNNTQSNTSAVRKVNRHKTRVAKSLVKQHNNSNNMSIIHNNMSYFDDDRNSLNTSQNLQLFDKLTNQLRPST